MICVDVNVEQTLLLEHTEVTIKQSKITIRGRFKNVYDHFVFANIFSEMLRVPRNKNTAV